MHEHYQIRGAIEPILNEAGFVVELESNQLDYYGSVRTVFVSDEKRVLLEWDGEEGFGFIDVWKNDRWERLPTNVLESSNSEFLSAIEELCTELKEYT